MRAACHLGKNHPTGTGDDMPAEFGDRAKAPFPGQTGVRQRSNTGDFASRLGNPKECWRGQTERRLGCKTVMSLQRKATSHRMSGGGFFITVFLNWVETIIACLEQDPASSGSENQAIF